MIAFQKSPRPFRRLCLSLSLLLILFVAGCAADQPGRLGGTLILEGEHTIAAGERLPGALLITEGSLLVAPGATLAGPLYMLSGDLDLQGEIAGDLNVLGGQVSLGPSARVAGDLNHGGGELALDPAATITGEVVEGTGGMSLPGLEEVERSPLEEAIRFLLEPLLLALAGYFLARFLPGPLSRVAAAAAEQPVVAGAFGLLVLIVIPALLIMIAFTMILLPLSLLGLLFGFFVVAYGWIAIGNRLGRWLGQGLQRLGWRERPLSRPWATFAGTLLLMFLLQMLEWIPIAGFALFVLTVALGAGAVLLTRFGWRRYVPQPVALPPADEL